MTYPPARYVDQCPKCRYIRPRPNGFNVKKIGNGTRFTCFKCDVPTVAVEAVKVPSLWPMEVSEKQKREMVV
jgi:hypothetical protein